MGTFLPRWVLTYRYSFAVALLFFVGALFVGNAETLISGELGFAAVNHSVAPSPGSPLHTILAQPFLLLPLGSVIFRLTLYAITTCAMVLFFFGVFLERRVSSRVVVIMVLVAIALSGIFFRNTLMVSDIPLTLLFILVMFHVVDLRSPLADLRMPLLLVFLTGLGCGGLHPSLRFLLPPMIILWLTTLRVAPRLFAAIPLFFLLGFGVVLFLPLSLGGFDHVSTIRGPGGLFSYLGTRSQGAPESGVFSFPLFFSNLKIMVEYLSDSFPFFLVPLAGAGVYYGFLSIYRRDFMTFFGIGVAAFLYTAWMVPDQIPQGGTGLISLFALWCAVAVGTVGLFGRWGARIWSDMGMALILLITILAIVLNMGESPRPQGSDHRALLREMVRKSKGKGIFVFSPSTFSRVMVALAGSPLPSGITVKRSRRVQEALMVKGPGQEIPVFVDPMVILPLGYSLEYVTPWFGKPVPETAAVTPGGPRWESLLAWLLKRPTGSRYARRETARLMVAWGNRLLEKGLLFTASRFASQALYLQPQYEAALILNARVLLGSGRPFEALDAVNRALSRRASSWEASLLKAQILMAQVYSSLLEYSNHLRVLDEAGQNLLKAQKTGPQTWEVALAFTRLYILKGDAVKAREWHATTLSRSGNHEKVARALRALRKIPPQRAP